MINSVLARQRLRGRPEGRHRGARGGMTRAAGTAVAAGIILAGVGLAGAAAPARAATQSLAPPSHDGVSSSDVGYVARGRWFRFASATLTVAPRTVADPLHSGNGGAAIALSGRPGAASISVAPGGGTGSIWWAASYHNQMPFQLAPRVGDRLALSVFYDQHGHDYFTVTDTTRGTTQTVRVTVGDVIYSQASLTASVDPAVTPPPATDTRLWQFTGTQLTTYTGVHGTMAGPWTAGALIDTSTGTSSGRVAASPSGLSHGGQDFGIWLRALPLTYTRGFAGYQVGGRSFRYVTTSVIILPPAQPAANGGTAAISLLHDGGPTPRPYARIEVRSGGGPGSVRYDTSTAAGAFTLSPRVGDQVAISIYYDQNGHTYLGLTILNRAISQTISTPAGPLIASMPYNVAWIAAMIDNTAVAPPPADTRIWLFYDSHVTTYTGDRGAILGPWATSEWTDTATGTAAGKIVMNAPVLWNGGQNFGAWLRHQ